MQEGLSNPLIWAGGLAALVYGKSYFASGEGKAEPEATLPEVLNFKLARERMPQAIAQKAVQERHCLRYSQIRVSQESSARGDWLAQIRISAGCGRDVVLALQVKDWEEGEKIDLQWALRQLFEPEDARQVKLLKCFDDEEGRYEYRLHLREGEYHLEASLRECYPQRFFGVSSLARFFVYRDGSSSHPAPLGRDFRPSFLEFETLRVSWRAENIDALWFGVFFQGQAEREQFSLSVRWNKPENPFVNFNLSQFVESLFHDEESSDYTILKVRYRREHFSEVALGRSAEGYVVDFKPCETDFYTATSCEEPCSLVVRGRERSIFGHSQAVVESKDMSLKV